LLLRGFQFYVSQRDGYQKLPYEFLRWVPTEGTTEEILQQLSEAGDDKYFFVEVDIAPLAEEFQDKASKLLSSLRTVRSSLNGFPLTRNIVGN
jgi:glutamate mutase epsilon subunit